MWCEGDKTLSGTWNNRNKKQGLKLATNVQSRIENVDVSWNKFYFDFLKDWVLKTWTISSNDIFKAVKYLQTFIDNKDFIACSVQNKFYVMPKQLKKGTAMERLKNRINEKFVICAGDSFLDISMLEIADIAISPKNIELKNKNHQILCEECFSTEMLRIAAKSIEECKIKAKLDIP